MNREMITIQKHEAAPYDPISWNFLQHPKSKISALTLGWISVGSLTTGLSIVVQTPENLRSIEHDVVENLGKVHKMTDSRIGLNLIPLKFQSAYKEITGRNVNWKDIPLNLQNSFLTYRPLSAQEVAKLPLDIRVAYLVEHKPSDDVIWKKIKKRLDSYEYKYGMSSKKFYHKYHNSEAMFDGTQEQVHDFLLWHGDYKRYLELKNGTH